MFDCPEYKTSCPCPEYSKEGLCDWPYRVDVDDEEIYFTTRRRILEGCQCYAQTVDVERQSMWDKIFPDGKVPITSPLPIGKGKLADQEAEFYFIDFDRVSPAEKESLIKAMSTKFHLTPLEVRQDIEDQGVRVKAENIIISWCIVHSRAVM